jgi:hypothetical protein
MHKPEKILGFVFVTGNQAAVVLKQRIDALDLPAFFVSAEFPAILMGRMVVVAPGEDNGFDAAIDEDISEQVRIVATIHGHDGGLFLNEPSVECRLRQFLFSTAKPTPLR